MLGWPDENIHCIDEDLGRSASGTFRSGFNYLLEEICASNVGAIISTNASRLARNGREWHTLLEYCTIVDTLLIDPETVYDLNASNDRLLLGFKGEFSEMELRTFQERSQAALKAKAQRGELYLMIGAGYVKAANQTLVKDPNKRVQEAIALVFEKFQQLGSIRQTHKWFLEQKIKIPVTTYQNKIQRLEWKIASANTFSHILDNPVYAGAYVYGRTKSIVEIRDGRKHIRKGVKQKREDWNVFIKDHHEGYISWQAYENNQAIIAHNTNRKRPLVMGSVTGSGHALLSGLLRCQHCGQRLGTRYQGNSGRLINYLCPGRETPCINFGGASVDNAIADRLLDIASTDGLAIAQRAIENLAKNQPQVQRQRLLALEQARYEEQRARRQFDAVEPENRLVAATLESSWNEALKNVSDLRLEIDTLESQLHILSEKDRAEIRSLAHDLPYVWHHPESSPSIKRNIIRTVIKEIMVFIEGEIIQLKIHWRGGDHTQVDVRKKRQGQTHKILDEDIRHIITALARIMPDKHITNFLNRQGKRTATGLTWTPQRVCSVRKDYRIPVYKAGEREERGDMTPNEVATELDLTITKVRKLIRQDIIPAKQVCFGAPWIIKREVLQTERLQNRTLSSDAGRPLTPDSKQKTFIFK